MGFLKDIGGLIGKNPVGGIGMMGDMMGGDGEGGGHMSALNAVAKMMGGGGNGGGQEEGPANPGQKMFGMKNDIQAPQKGGGSSFMERFREQLMRQAMGGFYGGGPS